VTSDSLLANGITTLTYYVDGALVGSTASNVYFTGVPNCGATGAITVSKTFTGNNSKTYNYYIKDDLGITLINANVTFKGNTCTSVAYNW
jgi:hypothetical protein